MPKLVADVFILLSLFAPLLLAVCIGREALSVQTSLLEMGGGWQVLFLTSLALPVFALRRLQLLKAPSQPPSLME